jgi:hypothetical protein
MSKAYETTINDFLFIRKENRHLHEKQKRQKSKKQISIEHGITGEEAQALVQGQAEVLKLLLTTAEPELPASQQVVRRQFRCSGYGAKGHRINRCPNKTSNYFFCIYLHVVGKL